MRISRTVSFSAYLRTINELAQFGITEADLPPRFYEMHWSERRRYIMHRYSLYVCPRCRKVCAPDQKHSRKQLCITCGDNAQHHLTVVPDEEILAIGPESSLVGVSKHDAPTKVTVDEILERSRRKE